MSPFASAARYLVKSVDLKALNWRHHGLGMIQGELDEELRIHIWHPDLVRLPKGFRRVHDHRFTISSAVVYGLIVDQPWDVVFPSKLAADSHPTNTQCWGIKHAKIQDAADRSVQLGCSTANDATLIEDVYARTTRGMERGYEAGDEYTIKRREFHTTIISGLAITVVHRSNFDVGLARVLGDESVKVGSAIQRDTSNEEIAKYIEMARTAVAS